MMANVLPGDNQILLESGTNELEVLVFRVGDLTLGVNVAQVREVLRHRQDVVALPKAHVSLVGCFPLRNHVVPCVSLHRHLAEPPRPHDQEALVSLTEFNRQQIGFVVDAVNAFIALVGSRCWPRRNCSAIALARHGHCPHRRPAGADARF